MTKETLLKKLGQRVASLREERGLSQTELGKLANKDRQSIFKLENGEFNPTVFYLHEIASAFGISVSELLDFK